MVSSNKIDFKNTTDVFDDLGTLALIKQIVMFYGMSSPFWSKVAKKMMSHKGIWFLGLNLLIKKWVFKHFCGGETVEQSFAVMTALSRYGILTIPDYSAEAEETEEFFDRTTSEVLQTIEASTGNTTIVTAVFKVSGIASTTLLEKMSVGISLTLAETEAAQRAQHRLLQMCSAAHKRDLPILIDAEESWIQPAIDKMAESMMELFNKNKAIIYNTFQLYRHDRLAFLKQSLNKAAEASYVMGVKLVRGAYMEKERERAKQMGYPSPIQANKEASDRDFNHALELCLSKLNTCSICVGTHNEESAILLMQLMENKGIALNDKRVLAAQLKGMSDHISRKLAQTGIRTAKYVPYGPVPKVIPYMIRRINENTAVAGEASRELNIRVAELKSRFRSFINRLKKSNYVNSNKRKSFRKPIL